MLSSTYLISFDESPVRSSTLSITNRLISWILLATLRLSSASRRICSATTAKPLPASPALAASMDAFNASIFVCEAIFNISSVSSWILSTWRLFSMDLLRPSLILFTISLVLAMPFSVSCLYSTDFSCIFSAMSLPCVILSVTLTIDLKMLSAPALNCSIVADTSCMPAAICCMAADTFCALSLTEPICSSILSDEVLIVSEAFLISFIIDCNLSINIFMPATSSPISSSDFTLILAVKSPLLFSISCVIALNCLFACFNGFTVTIRSTTMAIPITTIITAITTYIFIENSYWLLRLCDDSLTWLFIRLLRLSAALSSLDVILSSPCAVSEK